MVRKRYGVATFYSTLAVSIVDEAMRAFDKFGEQLSLTDEQWLAILTEEIGEAAHELTLDMPPVTTRTTTLDPHKLRAEVVQIAAVALRWVAVIDDALAELAAPGQVEGPYAHARSMRYSRGSIDRIDYRGDDR